MSEQTHGNIVSAVTCTPRQAKAGERWCEPHALPLILHLDLPPTENVSNWRVKFSLIDSRGFTFPGHVVEAWFEKRTDGVGGQYWLACAEMEGPPTYSTSDQVLHVKYTIYKDGRKRAPYLLSPEIRIGSRTEHDGTEEQSWWVALWKSGIAY